MEVLPSIFFPFPRLTKFYNFEFFSRSYFLDDYVHEVDKWQYWDILENDWSDANNDLKIKAVKEKSLFEACVDGDKICVQNHIQKENYDINEKDENGSTPLHCSSENGHHEIVKYLLEIGANPEMKDKKGRTPLHLASQNGHKKVVDILIKRKVNPNHQEIINGSTAMHLAASKGHLEIVNFLLNYGANYELTDKEFRTPAMCATFEKKYSIADLLARKLQEKLKSQNNGSRSNSENNQQSKNLEVTYQCSICFQFPEPVFSLDCGHLPFCDSCSNVFICNKNKAKRICPICKRIVKKKNRLYLGSVDFQIQSKEESQESQASQAIVTLE